MTRVNLPPCDLMKSTKLDGFYGHIQDFYVRFLGQIYNCYMGFGGGFRIFMRVLGVDSSWMGAIGNFIMQVAPICRHRFVIKEKKEW